MKNVNYFVDLRFLIKHKISNNLRLIWMTSTIYLAVKVEINLEIKIGMPLDDFSNTFGNPE